VELGGGDGTGFQLLRLRTQGDALGWYDARLWSWAEQQIPFVNDNGKATRIAVEICAGPPFPDAERIGHPGPWLDERSKSFNCISDDYA
jgi:hypothetical protein